MSENISATFSGDNLSNQSFKAAVVKDLFRVAAKHDLDLELGRFELGSIKDSERLEHDARGLTRSDFTVIYEVDGKTMKGKTQLSRAFNAARRAAYRRRTLVIEDEQEYVPRYILEDLSLEDSPLSKSSPNIGDAMRGVYISVLNRSKPRDSKLN